MVVEVAGVDSAGARNRRAGDIGGQVPQGVACVGSAGRPAGPTLDADLVVHVDAVPGDPVAGSTPWLAVEPHPVGWRLAGVPHTDDGVVRRLVDLPADDG